MDFVQEFNKSSALHPIFEYPLVQVFSAHLKAAKAGSISDLNHYSRTSDV
jgi:hypothetical protein